MSFSADISKFVKKAKLRRGLVMRKLALDAYTGVLLRSPVDTGRFRGNWRLSIVTPDLSTDELVSDAAGFNAPPTAEELGYAEQKLAASVAGSTIWITNNLPYAGRIENESWSSQAPAGVLAPTLQELEENVRQLNEAVINLLGD